MPAPPAALPKRVAAGAWVVELAAAAAAARAARAAKALVRPTNPGAGTRGGAELPAALQVAASGRTAEWRPR